MTIEASFVNRQKRTYSARGIMLVLACALCILALQGCDAMDVRPHKEQGAPNALVNSLSPTNHNSFPFASLASHVSPKGKASIEAKFLHIKQDSPYFKGPTTRSRATGVKKATARHGLTPADILFHKRRRIPMNDRSKPPSSARDNYGVRYFLPGNSEIMRKTIKFSGDSMADIRELYDETGRGGPGSGETWHHMHDYNPRTGKGTAILVKTSVHRRFPHVGGSAQARAHLYDDPQAKAKLLIR